MSNALFLAFICFVCAGSAVTLLAPSAAVFAAAEDLLTDKQLDLIRYGKRSHGVVVGMRTTGVAGDDFREVELDLMVSRPDGGQFPAQQTALIPVTALRKVTPGSVIDAYYRPDDETAIAICVAPD